MEAGRQADIAPVPVPPREFCGSACPLLIVGAWQLSAGHSALTDQQARSASVQALAEYARAGLVCFDCADIYTGVEALLGEVQQACPGVRIHTKCVPDLDAMLAGGVTREYLEAGVRRSLGRLQMGALDLVQLHWWDYDVPGFVDACKQLCHLSACGLIRAVGLTNTDLGQLQNLVQAGCCIASNQIQLSVLDRRPLRSGMAAFCESHRIELLCYGALAGGFLTDRWLGAEDPGFDALENRSLTKYRLIIDEYGSWHDFQRLLRVLSAVASRRETDIAGVAVGWVLRQTGSTRVILGARGAEHVAGAAASLNLTLSRQDLAEIDQEIGERGITGEVFEAERAGGRHTGIMRRNLNGVGGQAQVVECLARIRDGCPVDPQEVELLEKLGNDVSELRASQR